MNARLPKRLIRRSRHVWGSRRLWQQRLVFWTGGLLVGVAAVGFAFLADAAQQMFRWLIDQSPYLALLITPAGLAGAVYLSRQYFPGSGGSGIPQVIAARQLTDQHARETLLSLRLAAGKVVLTVCALAIGASAGREGPTVQVGASILHRLAAASGGRYRGVILAGAAAGVAAAFNTPLAGIVFAIEEMSRAFEQRTSGLVLTAVIVAGLASLGLVGDYTYFGHSAAQLTRAGWLLVPVCALVGGLLGALFSGVVVAAARGFRGRRGEWIAGSPVRFAAACGLGLALLGLVSGGTTYGTGYDEARSLVEGGWLGAGYGPFKLAATLLTSVSGVPGGIFAPSLAVGAGIGADIARILPLAPAGAIVLLGMVSYFSGVVQAPITAFVIVLEMTDDHALAIPLMTASLMAYGISRFTGTQPIYHALAHRFLAAAHAAERPSAEAVRRPEAP